MRRASLAYVVLFLAVGSWSPFAGPYYQSLGLSLRQIGLLASLSAGVGLVFGPVWGSIADRFRGSRGLMPVAALIAASSALVLALIGSSPAIPVAAAGMAIGLNGVGPLLDARSMELVGEDRGRYAHLRLWGSASWMVAAPIAGLLLVHRDASGAYSYAGCLYALAPLLVVTAVVLLSLAGRPAASVKAVGILRAPGRVLRDRTIALFLVGLLASGTALTTTLAFSSIYLQGLGASPEQLGLASSLGAVLEVPTMLLFPRLVRRFGLGRLIVVGAMVLAAREAGTFILTDPTLLIALAFVQGLGYALLLVGGVTFVSRHAPAGTAATAQGILGAVMYGLASIIGGSVGGLLAGWLTIRGLYVICALTGVAGVGLIAVAVLPASRKDAVETRSEAVASDPETPDVAVVL